MSAIHAVAAAFYPASTVVIYLFGTSISKNGAGTQTASYQINADGTVRNHAGTVLETWTTTYSGPVASYQARATVISGTVGGTTGAWVSCSTSPTWSVTNSAADGSTETAYILVEIRDAAAPNTVRASGTTDLNATSN